MVFRTTFEIKGIIFEKNKFYQLLILLIKILFSYIKIIFKFTKTNSNIMSQEIKNLINSLSEDNFRNLIKAYAQKRYKGEVRIIDGPWDGGNDLEIYVNGKDIRRNIQVTVQKIGYEDKLKKDLVKSQANIAAYSYAKSLDFYISQNISKESRNALELDAEVNYDIILRIYDGNFFSQELEKDLELVDLLYKMHNIDTEQKTKFSKSLKVVFDVLTHNSKTVEIKKNFISSFIYSYLFSNPNSTSIQIFENINPLLNNSLDKEYFDNELNHLRLQKFVLHNKETKEHILSDEKQQEIASLYAEVSNKETQLIHEIKSFLQGENIELELDELITFLYKIYQENYNIDIDEVTETKNSYSNSLRKSFEDLNTYFTKKGLSVDSAGEISRSLLDICSKNNFLIKLSAVHLFTNLFNSNKLEKYISSREQEIFIDTQILIRLICAIFPTNYIYKDLAINSVKILFDALERYKNKIEIITSVDYIEEVANHLLDAVKLRRFLDLPYISELGTSKNVFYNAYVELRKNKIIAEDISLTQFIASSINIDYEELESPISPKLSQKVQAHIYEIFEYLRFRIIRHDNYPNFQKAKKDYEYELAMSGKFRSSNAIQKDVRTMLYLSNSDYHINENGQIDEPYLVTWDTSFHAVRKKILEDPTYGASFFYIYSPMKMVDRLSVMNFTLNPESINVNIIALTETNFNYTSKTSSFLDVISSFFNNEDLSKLGIIKKLATLNKETQESDKISHHVDFTDEDESPILKLLSDIRNHYMSHDNYDFKDLVKIFEDAELENSIIETLTFGINHDSATMYQEFDKMITKTNSTLEKLD